MTDTGKDRKMNQATVESTTTEETVGMKETRVESGPVSVKEEKDSTDAVLGIASVFAPFYKAGIRNPRTGS